MEHDVPEEAKIKDNQSANESALAELVERRRILEVHLILAKRRILQVLKNRNRRGLSPDSDLTSFFTTVKKRRTFSPLITDVENFLFFEYEVILDEIRKRTAEVLATLEATVLSQPDPELPPQTTEEGENDYALTERGAIIAALVKLGGSSGKISPRLIVEQFKVSSKKAQEFLLALCRAGICHREHSHTYRLDIELSELQRELLRLM